MTATVGFFRFYIAVFILSIIIEGANILQSGPIIRITPTEIHVDDPDYYSILYERSGRLDKYAYMSGRFGFASDSSSTVDHETHRMRRKALNLFSDKKISDFQPVIRKKVAKFGEKLAEYQRDGRILPLDSGWMALTTDTITEYAFGRAYNQLDSPDFQDTMEEALLAIYSTGQFALHFPIVFPILDSLPDWFVMKVHPVLQPVVGLRKVRAVWILDCEELRLTYSWEKGSRSKGSRNPRRREPSCGKSFAPNYLP